MQAENRNTSPLSGRGSRITGPRRSELSLDSHLDEGTLLPSGTSESTLYTPPNEKDGLHRESSEPLASINTHMPAGKETPKRRCLPEPIETLSSSSRRDKSEPGSSFHQDSSATTGSRPRRFTPQLLETASRSVREDTPLEHCHNSQTPDITGDPAQGHAPGSSCSSDLPGVCDQGRRRRHLFRIPDLPTVPSSYSGDSCFSELPSLSPSASSSELEKQPKVEEYRRESCDEHFSQYLLSLAARSAEDQLKDRTLATFPNERVHQPITHFAINTEDDPHLSDEKPAPYTQKEGSSAGLSWELEYTHHHKEDAGVRSQAMLGSPMPTMAAQQILDTATQLQSGVNGNEQDDDLMVRPTSPPLLGDDLIFPQSLSPQGIRHIYGNSTHQRQGYFDQLYQPPEGLWCANLHVVQNGGDGLWMGTCHKPGESNGKSLFQGSTASADNNPPDDVSICPGEGLSCEDASQLSYSPSMTTQSASDTKRRLRSQDDLEELDNGFVTQIYNYLSLGYPCVAHDYDQELSDVSSIPIDELRQDNFHTNDKGFVGIIEGTAGNTEYTGYICMRWVALRLYIQEWAKRQTRIPGGVEASGVCERRGSWAG